MAKVSVSAKAAKRVIAWYDSARPLFLDLVGDYAGQELFLIEGDGMLREAFSDERLDFEDGFQILHAVYIVERLLEGLLARHCNFHLAFFEEHEMLCVPSTCKDGFRARYLLARSLIIRHLSQNLTAQYPGVQVLTFTSVVDENFTTYLHTAGLHFVMLHDGASQAAAIEGPKNLDKKALRAMIAWFNQLDFYVALINRIEIRDTKVFTMIVHQRAPPKVPDLRAFLIRETDTPSFDISIIQQCLSAPNSLKGQSDKFNLGLYTIASLLAEEKVEPNLASAFLLHTILIKQLRLSQRGFPSFVFEDELESKIQKLLTDSAVVANQILSDAQWQKLTTSNPVDYDLVDLFDGRLLKATICALANHGVPSHLASEWNKAQATVESLSGHKLSDSFDFPVPHQDPDEAEQERVTILPFKNDVFEKHLSIVQISTVEDSSGVNGKIFRDLTHWHTMKPLVQKKPLPVKPVSRRHNPLRTHQWYMAEMTAYAASLTGTSGKTLTPETIIVGPRAKVPKENGRIDDIGDDEGNNKQKKPAGGKPKKVDTKKMSKADIIRAANTEKKAGTESDKAFAAWQIIMKGHSAIADHQQRYLRTKAYLAGIDAKNSPITADVLLYMLSSLVAWWAECCKEDKANGYHVVALIWTVSLSFVATQTTKEIAAHVMKVCALIGIDSAAEHLTKASAADRKLSFVFKYPNVKAPALKIELSQTEFQLLHCGPYMDRSTDGKPDPRVPRFIPDGWQRKVLDELDQNHSIFVVAPTSSGKTFISFYAMEQVLRANNEDVLVYVAPTKALVNQIAAEVQANFRKTFPQAGRCVWAIHTRDYRINNSTGCQILVTVPHILQTMLLAPSNAKSWAPRVKRIIFDEIHSIGQADDGVVWEQLLLLAPCPIIALSATIGNPATFRDWLQSTQKACGFELTMIQHDTRYSDLRKYTYSPPKAFQFDGLGKAPELGCALGLDGLEGLNFFHPVASLTEKSRGMPADLSLEPRDCLLLYKAMVKFQTEKYPMPKSLSPEKFLPAVIKKADSFKWEKGLKKVLLQWMDDRSSPFDQVVQELSPKNPVPQFIPVSVKDMPMDDDSTDSDGPHDSDGSADSVIRAKKTVDDQYSPKKILKTTLPLLVRLHQRNALPAILFNYDRSQCENIGAQLLEQLTDAEVKFKETSASWKKTMRDFAKYTELKETRQNKKPAKATKSKGDKDDDASNKNSKDSQMRDEASGENSFFDLFDPEEPLEDYSFADKKRCQREELEGIIKQLRYKRIPEYLISLLHRGIGIHHSGMNRKYRQCVEMLFRKAFLRVVVATGTLSLGINMPCATVVFSGDSVFLTALNFRQAAGRSGRRNFDALGNVVFQHIAKERVCRILSSRLPDLTGHFPLTTSLVLRLCTLLDESKSPYARTAIDALLSQPRMYLGGEDFKEKVLHHLRFSLEYLRRQDLLGPHGEPINFTSCVSHLYYTENSAFAFHALLKSKYFTSLCADIDNKPSMILRELMLVMSHLFGRKEKKEVDDPNQAEKIRRSPSMVYLEPLPEEAARILRAHNDETLKIFSSYAKTFAEQHLTADEDRLPLTKISVGNEQAEQMEFTQHQPKPTTRSLFVGLSGHTDNFHSVSDLCTSTRAGVFLEEAVIPALPVEPRTPLNAYLLDFYMHGALQPLEAANGIRRSDVWFNLNDFSLVLATVVTSLGNYLGVGAHADLDQLDVMGSGDVLENMGDATMAEELPMVAAAAAAAPPPPPADTKPSVVASRKKQTEDWEAQEEKLASADRDRGASSALTDDDSSEYAALLNVYKAFQLLKTEFDAKFHKIWA